MRVSGFRVFIDLVETESFSQAGFLNGITQSAVSQKVKSIEKIFNVKIIDQNKKKFHLTASGKKIYQSAKKIVHVYDILLLNLKESENVSGKESIHISSICSVGLFLFPLWLKDFCPLFPQIDFQLRYRKNSTIYEDILSRSADLGIVSYPKPKKGIKSKIFMQDPLVCVCTENSIFSSQKTILLRDIAQGQLIIPDRSLPLRFSIEKLFKMAGVQPNILAEFDNIETIKSAIVHDTHIAILPQIAVRGLTSFKKLIIEDPLIPSYFLLRPIATILRSNGVLPFHLKQFLSFIYKYVPFPID